jgi:two-component system, OmpR family, response regulator BaeR
MSSRDQPLILIVEDEPKIAGLLKDYLEANRLLTHLFDNGLPVTDWVRQQAPDVILLDLMLPGKDGLQLCREIRAFSDVPIIMITARVEEIDRLIGLDLGADDYICKPFSPREVVARVNVILRRVQRAHVKTAVYRGLNIDQEKYQASVDSRVLDLTPVEFRMLTLMAGAVGRVFSRDQLQSTIYLDGRIVSDRTVDTHIKNLRRKLRAVYGDEEVVHSIYGVGYRFE